MKSAAYLTLSLTALMIGAVISPVLAAYDRSDPGLMALALKLLPRITEVPFAGGHESLNGYEWPSSPFRANYSNALNDGIPPDYLAGRPWMRTFEGPTVPSELIGLHGRTLYFKGGNGSREVTPFRQLGIDPRRGRRFLIRCRVSALSFALS
jgi:hypothetical protein